MASRERRGKQHRRFEPFNSRAGVLRFKNRLTNWGIPRPIVDDFAEHNTRLSYPKGSVIFSQNSPADFLAWVERGIVEVVYQEVDFRPITMRFVGPGDILGWQSYIASDSHPVHAFESRARTDCDVALINRERVVNALRAITPATLVLLLQNLNAAWAEREQYSAMFLRMNYRKRLEMVFAELAARFGARGLKGTVVTLELGHNELAGLIGCSRPMLTQLIAIMQRAGQISRADKHYIIRRITGY